MGPPGGTTFQGQAEVTQCFCCVIESRIKQRRHVCAREANAEKLNVSGCMEGRREYTSPGGRHRTATNICKIADHLCATPPLQDALICKRIPPFRIPKSSTRWHSKSIAWVHDFWDPPARDFSILWINFRSQFQDRNPVPISGPESGTDGAIPNKNRPALLIARSRNQDQIPVLKLGPFFNSVVRFLFNCASCFEACFSLPTMPWSSAFANQHLIPETILWRRLQRICAALNFD